MWIFLLINWLLGLGIQIVQLTQLFVTELIKIRLLQWLPELHCSLDSLHTKLFGKVNCIFLK